MPSTYAEAKEVVMDVPGVVDATGRVADVTVFANYKAKTNSSDLVLVVSRIVERANGATFTPRGDYVSFINEQLLRYSEKDKMDMGFDVIIKLAKQLADPEFYKKTITDKREAGLARKNDGIELAKLVVAYDLLISSGKPLPKRWSRSENVRLSLIAPRMYAILKRTIDVIRSIRGSYYEAIANDINSTLALAGNFNDATIREAIRNSDLRSGRNAQNNSLGL